MSEHTYRLEIFDRAGEPLCDLNGVLGVRWAYDKQLVFEIPVSHYKNRAEFFKEFNLVRCQLTTIPNEPWTGFIYDMDESDPNGLTKTVTCSPMKTLLNWRLTEVVKFENKQPGEILAALIAQANSEEHTGIYVGESTLADATPQTVECRFDSVQDKIQEVCDKADITWKMTYNAMNVHVATFVDRQQRDLSASVIVQAGFDTDEVPPYRPDNSNFANSIVGIGKLPDNFQVPTGQDEYLYRPRIKLQNLGSIGEYGLKAGKEEFDDASDPATLSKLTQTALDKRSRSVIENSFVLNNRRGLWSQFTDGDVIQLQIPNPSTSGLVMPVLVTGREVDPEKGLMTVAYTVVRGAKAEALDMFKLQQVPGNPIYAIPAADSI